MEITSSMQFLSGKDRGIIQLSNRYFTRVGFIKNNLKMIVEVPVLLYGNNPAGGEISADYIGAFTYFNYNPEVRGVQSIGRFCSIGPNVVIGMGGHSTTALSHHQIFEARQTWSAPFWESDWEWVSSNFKQNMEKEPKRKKKTYIGNDVWIGANANILSGVRVGDGAIIAAGSVVTKDVEPYTIVGGSPAKVLRNRFSPKLTERIKKTQWWNYGPNILKGLNISEPELCIDELEERIKKGFPLYEPDKFEFDAKNQIITKINKNSDREIVYKL